VDTSEDFIHQGSDHTAVNHTRIALKMVRDDIINNDFPGLSLKKLQVQAVLILLARQSDGMRP